MPPTSEFTGNPIYTAVSAAAAKSKAAAVAEPAPPSAPSTAWTGGGDENKANAHTNVNKVNVPADGLVRTVFKLAKVAYPPCPYPCHLASSVGPTTLLSWFSLLCCGCRLD